MALPELHPISEVSRSIGASPEAAYIRAPFRGGVLKVGFQLSSPLTGVLSQVLRWLC
jgi:hypothetical protein